MTASQRRAPLRTGLFGGTFNPIHTGHVALGRSIVEAGLADEVWFMVSPQNPFKRDLHLLDDTLRLAMVRKALAGEPHLVASDYEFSLPRPSYTLNTLRHLAADYPDREFILIIGGDNWEAFGQWYGHDEILTRWPVVVYPRTGAAAPDSGRPLPEGVTLLHTPLLPVSSTAIRERVRRGERITGLVPEAIEQDVEKYYKIKEN